VESFESWLDALRKKRERWVAASHENDFDRGIWNATVEKYADPTHFIFELLQNAEDADATWARFELTPGAVIFDHDGRPFERRDIEGITGIGNTTKLEEANKIGCFGIGFKSVYVVAERPQVHCTIEGRSVAFAIHDLVVPELIAAAQGPASTRFVLPLPFESAAATIAKVLSTLDQSGPRSLLYLQQLRRLEWTDGSTQARCVVEDGDDGIRTLRTTADDKPAQVDRFLVLSRPVRRDGAKSDLSVNIAMRLNDGGEIVPETTPTRLSVFFEIEEQTGLHMHVHGPFQLTDNRANIKRDNEWNAHIVDELAALLAESLPGLRDRGMIKRSFLEVLPNGSDDLSEPWDRLRTAAIAAFRKHPLMPAHFGGHVRAGDAARGPADIRDLLRDEGLASFAGLPDRRWATGVLRNSRADAFLSSLEIAEWGGAELLAAFQRTFGPIYSYSSDAEVARKACAWFDGLDDEVVQRLYLLVDAAIRTQKRSISLTHAEFVRLEDGNRARPGEVLLPPTGAPVDEEAAAHGLVLVRSALLRSGRGRGKDVEQFLRRVGVKEIGERDYLRAIISANYAANASPATVERHMQHMRRFLRWHAEHGDVRMLEGVAFLRVEGAEGYQAPSAVYLDQPFVTGGLSLIYDGNVKGRDRRPLWNGYGRLKREPLLALLKALRVEDKLAVYRTTIPYTHPHRSELVYCFGAARVTDSCENIDYTIPQLPALLGRSNPDISKQIWRAIAAAGSHVIRASYAPNQTHEPQRAPSTLALCLRDAAWIPAKDGSLRRPSAITAPELADGFSTKGNEEWLHAIGFAAEHRRRSEEHQARRRAAQTIGLPAELVDQLATLSPEALEELGNEMLRRVASGAFSTPEFPEREAPNPERRAVRIAERARAAPTKTHEVRERSIRTSDKEARQLARPYLVDFYTNDAGEMVCQACHQMVPFNLPDGSPYFEAPELLPEASAELAENYLALCPTCCAKWRHARATSDAEVIAALRSAQAPQITVTLAGETTLIRFVQVHLDDLRAILSVTDEMTSSPAAVNDG
jgi:hypothetical protein